MNTNEMNMGRLLRQKDAENERLNEQLERERQQAREAIDAVRNGEPLGSIAGKHMIRNQQVEIENLKALWYADADPEETAYAKDYYSRVDERDHAAIAKAALSGKELT